MLSSYSPFPGVVLASVGADTSDVAYDAFVDHSGKIVAVGDSYSPETYKSQSALFRFESVGTLDATFGTQGVVTTALPKTSNTYGRAVAEYPSKESGSPPDRILAGGFVYYRKTTGTAADFALARYNSNGTLDATFGNSGTVQTDFGGGNYSYGEECIKRLLVQEDGRIVAAGQLGFADQPTCFALARYTADGQLDPSFGTEGVVKTWFGSGDASIRDAIWHEGKILAVGAYSNQFVLARYTLDGQLDPDFGNGGIVITTFAMDAGANAAAVDSSGNLIVVGACGDHSSHLHVTLARYHRDGSLDTTFGTDGSGIVVTEAFPGAAIDVAILPGGEIVVGGTATSDPSTGQTLEGFMVARYHPDGTVDSDFGTGGITVTPILDVSVDPPNTWAGSMALQTDGKIVLAGGAPESTPTGTRWHLALARYNSDGTLDETFGVVPPGITVTPTSGLVTTEAGGTASFSVVLNT
ncbi:MAG: hypothetical protein NUV77_26995, partial [Thermoguttaceae bacterium]|nr:hypothetical protein [Thermoguttaceae bacterium]